MVSVMLPNVFIVGAAKCGTTTLYDLLRMHDQVFVSLVKEPQFFSNDDLYSKGFEDYSLKNYHSSSGYPVRIDATPHYIYYEKAANRLSKLPDKDQFKFILILRDPVHRAYSLYWNMVREGYEKLGFEDALLAEKERIEKGDMDRIGTVRYQYFDSGLYAKQIKAYLKYFRQDQFLVLFQDDLRDDPQLLIDKITDFLNIHNLDISNISKESNKSAMPRIKFLHKFIRGDSKLKKFIGAIFPYSLKYIIVTRIINMNMKSQQYAPIRKETEKTLRKRYLSDVIELEGLLGMDLSKWKSHE